MRPVLVLLNGLPGSGKSTLARRWSERDPTGLALALDLDVLRGMVVGWQRRPIEAGLAARAMAAAAIEVHLRAGHDVVVAQFLEQDRFADELADTARRSGAVFLECALIIDVPSALDRIRERALSGGGLHEGDLGTPLIESETRLSRFLAERASTVRLESDRPNLLQDLIAAIEHAR